MWGSNLELNNIYSNNHEMLHRMTSTELYYFFD